MVVLRTLQDFARYRLAIACGLANFNAFFGVQWFHIDGIRKHVDLDQRTPNFLVQFPDEASKAAFRDFIKDTEALLELIRLNDFRKEANTMIHYARKTDMESCAYLSDPKESSMRKYYKMCFNGETPTRTWGLFTDDVAKFELPNDGLAELDEDMEDMDSMSRDQINLDQPESLRRWLRL